MVAFAELDERVPFGQQLGQDDGPIVLFNTFHVAPDELDAFMEPWEPDGESIKRQPGYISTQLRRGIPGFVGIDMATGTPPTPIGEADRGVSTPCERRACFPSGPGYGPSSSDTPSKGPRT